MVTYGLLGCTLSHSFSSAFFTEKFAREGIDAVYQNFEIENIAALPAILDSHPTLRGLNVTIPYKQAVIPYLDYIDQTAAAIGAVNTIKISYDIAGKRILKGYNTDAPGFLDGLTKLYPSQLPTTALLLGCTGGAAQAVRYALEHQGISVLGVSRIKQGHCISYNEVDKQVLSEHQVIVNCTPLGTFPNIDTKPDIPYEYLTPAHCAYDLVYNPANTAFMQEAARQGARTINGLTMLHSQALHSYRIWTEMEA